MEITIRKNHRRQSNEYLKSKALMSAAVSFRGDNLASVNNLGFLLNLDRGEHTVEQQEYVSYQTKVPHKLFLYLIAINLASHF